MSGYTDLTKMESSRNCLRRIARHDEQQFSKDSIVNVMEKFVKTVNIMDNTILVPCRLMDRQVGDSSDIIPTPGKDSTSNQHTLSLSAHGKRGASHSKNVHEFLNSSELFNLYNMLNSLKNDLLWTASHPDADDLEDDETALNKFSGSAIATTTEPKTEAIVRTISTISSASSASSSSSSSSAASTTITAKGHARRPSNASVASTTSVSNLSDAESEISNENDSGVESESNKGDNAQSSSAGSTSSSEDVGAAKAKKAANADKATELMKRCRRHLNGLYQCLEQMTEAANYLTARYQSDIGSV